MASLEQRIEKLEKQNATPNQLASCFILLPLTRHDTHGSREEVSEAWIGNNQIMRREGESFEDFKQRAIRTLGQCPWMA